MVLYFHKLLKALQIGHFSVFFEPLFLYIALLVMLTLSDA